MSPDESAGGVGEADGSKKGKEKEGAKVSWEESGEEREGGNEREGGKEGERKERGRRGR